VAAVLITGANGFIGTHLAELLVRRGEEVACLVRATSRTQRLDRLTVNKVFGDVTDAASLREPVAGKQVVYHLAGCVRTVRTRQYYEVNEGGLANVARVCAEQDRPPLLVVVSSLAAVAPSQDGRPIREDHPPAPVSHYGRSKLAGDRAAAAYADRVPMTIVRPAGVFGEADRGCLEMLRMIDRFGVHLAPKPLGLSMIHADDLAQLIVLAAERGRRVAVPGTAGSDSSQGYYFAACEEYPMYDELGRMMGEALGRRRTRVVRVGRLLAWTVATVNEMVGQLLRRPLLFNFDKAREATAGRWFCSAQRAKEELGFSPAASLAERLRQTVEWYRSEGWL
jgi:nucleoside-diphosphate-sugar epimerase